MVYSDTTNKTGILQRCEFNLSLPDGAITGDSTLLAHFTGLVNTTYNEIFTEILASQDTWDFDDRNHTDYAIATTPLVAGQRDYSFPTSLGILRIKRVDITYDGTNYYQSSAIDSYEFGDGLGNTTTEDDNFSNEKPAHDIKADTIWVYPLATASQVASGAKVRIEFYRELDDFTVADTTQEPGIDRPFHELIPLGASMQYAVIKSLDNAKNLKTLYEEGIFKLKNYYSRKQDDKNSVLNTPISISDYS